MSSVPLITIDSSVVYREQGGASFTVTKDLVRDKRTNETFSLHYASVSDGKTGAVCVVEHEGKILIAKHWRASVKKWLWEFPRGMGKIGEEIPQTAMRELREETGIVADRVVFLQHIHADAGVLKDDIAVVNILLEQDYEKQQCLDWELYDLVWKTPSEINEMIYEGSLVDSITISSYTIWKSRAAKNKTLTD